MGLHPRGQSRLPRAPLLCGRRDGDFRPVEGREGQDAVWLWLRPHLGRGPWAVSDLSAPYITQHEGPGILKSPGMAATPSKKLMGHMVSPLRAREVLRDFPPSGKHSEGLGERATVSTSGPTQERSPWRVSSLPR